LGAIGRKILEARAFYARQMAAASGSTDPRLERTFAIVPREAFLPPPPWHVMVGHHFVEVPGDDPAYLYQDSLVALDRRKGINNGEPSLHAGWMAAVAPQPGETVVHIGAGMGYYTAILSLLVEAGGKVVAFEIDPTLAKAAAGNLQLFENVTVIEADAVNSDLPAADIIYVNAGVVAPPVTWLQALNLGGRLIFPWTPTPEIGLAVLAIRMAQGLSARVLSGAWFIPCTSASDPELTLCQPTAAEARNVRSIVLSADRDPDESAVAVYGNLWFSTEPP
jgi:protein-L-isoaspartate(D-aspartate) O-methyltransferase